MWKNLQKSGLLIRLAESYSYWCSLVLNGYIGHIIIYIPSDTMSGIGADGKYFNDIQDKKMGIETTNLAFKSNGLEIINKLCYKA